jgi:acetyltransferase
MSTYRLKKLFSAQSVAIVGASPRDSSAGHAVLKNLRRGGFAGTVCLVNPRYGEIEGVRATKTYDGLPAVPDVAVIAVPPAVVPSAVAAADMSTGRMLSLSDIRAKDDPRNMRSWLATSWAAIRT